MLCLPGGLAFSMLALAKGETCTCRHTKECIMYGEMETDRLGLLP